MPRKAKIKIKIPKPAVEPVTVTEVARWFADENIRGVSRGAAEKLVMAILCVRKRYANLDPKDFDDLISLQDIRGRCVKILTDLEEKTPKDLIDFPEAVSLSSALQAFVQVIPVRPRYRPPAKWVSDADAFMHLLSTILPADVPLRAMRKIVNKALGCCGWSVGPASIMDRLVKRRRQRRGRPNARFLL